MEPGEYRNYEPVTATSTGARTADGDRWGRHEADCSMLASWSQLWLVVLASTGGQAGARYAPYAACDQPPRGF